MLDSACGLISLVCGTCGDKAVYENGVKLTAGLVLIVVLACGSSACQSSTKAPIAGLTPTATPPTLAAVPPPGSERPVGGCGEADVYKGGKLPDWATVNSPQFLPYVVATPAIAVGYVFTYPLAAGVDANTKILWYVAVPRAGSALVAEGHPLGATQPIATFTKAADSFPGEIYPTGPKVPAAGCWHFTLAWQDGKQRTDVDLLFR